jgi:general secretion pathway protein A
MPLWTRWAAGGVIAAGVALFTFGVWQFGGAATLKRIDSTFRSMTDSKESSGAMTAAAAKPVALPAPTPLPAATSIAATPPMSFVQLTQTAAGKNADGGSQTAFNDLFKLWRANYRDDETDPCTQAAEQGLECVVQRGSWGQLRALNRPAILMVTDDAGIEHQLVLTKLGDEQATVQYGGQPYQIGVAEVSRYWFGDFLLLWRPQVAGGKPLSMGMQGAAVRWLRHSLETVQGIEPTAADADVYDGELVRLVENFQRDHRLTVDGVAGKQTQMMLDSALAPPDTPLLTAPPAKGS